MTRLQTPVVEKLAVREASLNITVDMTLAGLPVSVSGTYNVHSNVFYPGTITFKNIIENLELDDSSPVSLEGACNRMGWHYYDTHNAIQEAVEKRDW